MSDAATLEATLNNLYKSISNRDARITKNNPNGLIDEDTKMMCRMIKTYRYNFQFLNRDAKLRLLQQGQEVQRLFEKYNESCKIIELIKEKEPQTHKENKRTSKDPLPAKPAKLPPLFGRKSNSTRVAPAQAQASVQAPEQAPVARRNSARVAPLPERSPIHSIKPTVPRKRDYLFKFMNYLTIRMKGDKYKKKIEYIHYFDMRFQYFLKFLKNIASILNLYKRFLNPTQLQLINDMINNVVNIRCKWGNITLDENALNNLLDVVKLNLADIRALNSITLADIREKIFKQNTFIKDFLDAISAILGTGVESVFRAWLNKSPLSPENQSINYINARMKINDIILKSKKYNLQDDSMDKRKEEVDNMLYNAYGIEFNDDTAIYSNSIPIYTMTPIQEYNEKKGEYIRSSQLGGGKPFNWFMGRKSPKEQTRVSRVSVSVPDIIRDELSETADIYKHMNIKEFFDILNDVLKYIDVIALYLHTRLELEVIDIYTQDLIKIKVLRKIREAIEDSEDYKKDLEAYEKKNGLFMFVKSLIIHQSIYICIHSFSKGGRKRAIGRPRKTPAKPAKKPTTKPTKPTKKPTPKPTKSVAKKPVKPTKK